MVSSSSRGVYSGGSSGRRVYQRLTALNRHQESGTISKDFGKPENNTVTWFFEEPLSLLLIGILIEAFLLCLFLLTGRRSILITMGITCGFSVAALITEHIVVTDGEAVIMTLHQITRDLEKNNSAAIAMHIATTAPSLKRVTMSRLRRVEIKDADLKGKPKVTFYSQAGVRCAVADVKGLVVGNDNQGFLQNFHYFRRFLVHFRNEAGIWKVYDYEEQSPL